MNGGEVGMVAPPSGHASERSLLNNAWCFFECMKSLTNAWCLFECMILTNNAWCLFECMKSLTNAWCLFECVIFTNNAWCFSNAWSLLQMRDVFLNVWSLQIMRDGIKLFSTQIVESCYFFDRAGIWVPVTWSPSGHKSNALTSSRSFRSRWPKATLPANTTSLSFTSVFGLGLTVSMETRGL